MLLVCSEKNNSFGSHNKTFRKPTREIGWILKSVFMFMVQKSRLGLYTNGNNLHNLYEDPYQKWASIQQNVCESLPKTTLGSPSLGPGGVMGVH